MSSLFCSSPYLCELERQMQQPPGYRPRGKGIHIDDERMWKDKGSYMEIIDYVIAKIQMEHLKQRIQEIFISDEKELIFRNTKHRKDFYCLLSGSKAPVISRYSNYGAAVFLLSADEKLWKLVHGSVLDTGIYFNRIKLGSVNVEQYILFHAAKDIYSGSRHIRLAELTDRELISDEMLRLIVNAFVIEKCGVGIIRREIKQ